MNIVDKILVDPITRGLKFFTKGGACLRLGERIGATISTGATLTSGVATDCASLALPAGVWTVYGKIYFERTVAPTTWAVVTACINTVSAVRDQTNEVAVQAATVGNDLAIAPAPYYLNVGAPTTVYLVGTANYSGGAIRMDGVSLSYFFAVRAG